MYVDKELYTPLKLCCEKHNWPWEDNRMLFANINCKNKGNLYLYNYNDAVLVERNHPLLVKCRGLIVDQDGNIINYPFDRFFNDFEKECGPIDWNTTRAQEKADGSLICVWWHPKLQEWDITTRGTFYPNQNADVDFKKLFKKHFKNFDSLLKKCCYMFELVTSENRIVTRYDEDMVYLLSARYIPTLEEVAFPALSYLAHIIKVKIPEQFDVDDIMKCKKLLSPMRDDEEGLVVVDDNFNRIKLKQESYIRLSRIKNLKEQDIFNYILGKTEIDQEYLKMLPEVIIKIGEMKIEWERKLIYIRSVYKGIKHLTDRKEFASEACKYEFKGVLFNMLDDRAIEDLNLQWKYVVEW